MPRTSGAKSKSYKTKRVAMLERIGQAMFEAKGKPLSWRDMAQAAGVGLATLTHYFGKRDDVVLALLEHWGAQGAEPLHILSEPSGPFEVSIPDALGHLVRGLNYGVGEIIGVGLAEGMTSDSHGPAFIETNLEPLITAAKTRLEVHQNIGDMIRSVDLRIAALALISPVVIAYLHQEKLGGRNCHPLDFEEFIEQHAKGFVRAYGS